MFSKHEESNLIFICFISRTLQPLIIMAEKYEQLGIGKESNISVGN